MEPDWKNRPADIDKANEPGYDNRGRALKCRKFSPMVDDAIEFQKGQRKKDLQRRVMGDTRLTPRQEKFCQLMATLEYTATSAAIEAGFAEKYAASQASRMLKVNKIKNRIEELRVEAGKRNEVTLDECIENLRQIIDEGFQNGQLSAALGATKALGEFIGMFNLKNTQVNFNIPLTAGDDEKDAERLSRIARLASKPKGRETDD